MITFVPVERPGMVFTEQAIEGLREYIGDEIPLKAGDQVVGKATILNVVRREDGLHALEVEMEGEFVESMLSIEGPLAAMLSLRAMPEAGDD